MSHNNIQDGFHKPSAGLYMDTTYYNQYPPGMKMTDGIPEELREVIHAHWDQYSPANPLIAHFFGIMFFFLWLMNFFGNGLVIFIFSKVKSLRTPTNMFVINLAISDLIMMTSMGPPVTINIFLQRYWAWGVFGCKLYGCVGAVCGVVSILTMVVIGYDRYNVIVKGFNGTKITAGKALIIIMSIWGYSIAISALALFDIWGGYTVEGLLFTCSYDYLTDDANNVSYILFTCFFMYLLPMSLVFFFYSSIVKAVWAHEMTLKQQAKKMNVESLRSNVDTHAESAEIRIAKVAVTNVSLWAGIWSPYTIVVLMAVMGSKSSITPLISQLPSFIAKTASCLNPMVYAMSHPKYREALMREVPCLGIEEETPEEIRTTKEPVKA
ncbi:OPN4 [Lepeophtheirus salmonis]|uniref:OPN4 n=1 Tax=Lepeophtheirus salmonis TaxID=72036 RepID=A0A0K2V5Z5_LEPSM|nr:compound eye opsin BCRH2-like [Lepeophtheirus salmonis]CAB4056322.1 OPN4 [Lepeophtheirus salmonis]CAF2796152.1 OPN4 [Lepeophtheirus salmonis]